MITIDQPKSHSFLLHCSTFYYLPQPPPEQTAYIVQLNLLAIYNLFMQNELEAKWRSLRVSSLKTQTGDQFQPRYTRNGMIMQNEPNSNPISENPKNEPNSIQEKGLRKIYNLRATKKQTQFSSDPPGSRRTPHPSWCRPPKQTQNEPNFSSCRSLSRAAQIPEKLLRGPVQTRHGPFFPRLCEKSRLSRFHPQLRPAETADQKICV